MKYLGRRYVLVLHDGAPVGFRKVSGRDVPVFNELAVLRSSGLGTFEVNVAARSLDDLVGFERACRDRGCGVEDWSTIRVLCRPCSEGHAHAHPHPEPTVEGEHRFAIAAASGALAAQAVSDWIAADPARVAGGVTALLEPSAAAIGGQT